MTAKRQGGKYQSKRARRAKSILLLVDEEAISAYDPQLRSLNGRKVYMEHRVARGLRKAGFKVDVYPFSDGKVDDLISRVDRDRTLVVFNLVEHVRTDRLLSPDVPALLELLKIPFTGCDSVGMSLALDKAGSKQMLIDKNLTAPRFIVVAEGAICPKSSLRFPVIVKPRYEGGSDGISRSSLVHNHMQLEARTRFVHRMLHQPAICEEFIEGREFSVGVLGNGPSAFALPVRETVFSGAAQGGPSFATQMVKASERYRERWNISYCKAAVDDDLEHSVRAFCLDAYRELNLGGYARIDLRRSPDGGLFFLEANANPDLSPHVFGVMAAWAGMDFGQLLHKIIGFALERRQAWR